MNEQESWEKEFEKKFVKTIPVTGERLVQDTERRLKNFIRNLLSSRDTYWKERVRKEVEAVREAQVEHKDTCPNTFNKRKACDCGAKINERINQALDTLLEKVVKDWNKQAEDLMDR